jgi:hypothetical protein
MVVPVAKTLPGSEFFRSSHEKNNCISGYPAPHLVDDDLGRDELAAIQLPLLRLLPFICQQIVKFMSLYVPKYVINLISGYSLGV